MTEDVYLLLSVQIVHYHVASGCEFDDTAETGGGGGGVIISKSVEMTGLMCPLEQLLSIWGTGDKQGKAKRSLAYEIM